MRKKLTVEPLRISFHLHKQNNRVKDFLSDFCKSSKAQKKLFKFSKLECLIIELLLYFENLLNRMD